MLTVVLLAALAVPTAAGDTSQKVARKPASGAPAAIGGYAAGCLQGAQALPAAGPGFQVIRRERARYYGHPALIEYIQRLGRRVQAAGIGLMLVGDMAQPRGGPMASGHASHQTGLDADIWFRLAERPLDAGERERPLAVSMVRGDGRGIDGAAWHPSQLALLRLAADFPETDRIFVNPVIKHAACQAAAGERDWLAKLRPWWGHDAHFHVRLRCPPGSDGCIAQEPPPPGDGCGEELAGWLSASTLLRADAPARKPAVVLPPQCRDVLARR